MFEGANRLVEAIILEVHNNLDLATTNIRLSDMKLTMVYVRFRECKLQRTLEPHYCQGLDLSLQRRRSPYG